MFSQMSAGSYGRINSCLFKNQDMTIHKQAVQGSRFFDLDTDFAFGESQVVHTAATGDPLLQVISLLPSV